MAEGKRKPGGQAGHTGKTRQGFGRVDRYEVVHPQLCSECGGREFADIPVSVRYQAVAELVEPAIEVVEYEHQYGCGSFVGWDFVCFMRGTHALDPS